MFHFLVFGQHFISHGSGYKLLRELDSLPEGDIEIQAPPEFRPFVGESVRKNLNAAYQRHERAYNARCSRNVSFQIGQEVFYRNFQPSNFVKPHNAKLGKQGRKLYV